MAAAPRYDWEAIRAEYEAGASQSSLSQKYGASRKAIQKRIAAEGWAQDVSGTVNRLAEAKVAGIVAGCDPQKKAQALDAAAERTADVLRRHRNAWPEIKALAAEARIKRDFELAKLAKISAETERIVQDGERKAWGISDSVEAKVSAAGPIAISLAAMDRDLVERFVDSTFGLEGRS